MVRSMQGYVKVHQTRIKAANRRLRRKVARWRRKTIIRHRHRRGARSHG